MKNTKIKVIDIITALIGLAALVFISISVFVTTQPYLIIGSSLIAVATVINVVRMAKGYNNSKKAN